MVAAEQIGKPIKVGRLRIDAKASKKILGGSYFVACLLLFMINESTNAFQWSIYFLVVLCAFTAGVLSIYFRIKASRYTAAIEYGATLWGLALFTLTALKAGGIIPPTTGILSLLALIGVLGTVLHLYLDFKEA